MYAKEKYGAYPYFGELDLRTEYLTGELWNLRISIYHATETIHIDRRNPRDEPDTDYVYPDNSGLINTRWCLGYRVGATQTETRTEVIEEMEEDEPPRR